MSLIFIVHSSPSATRTASCRGIVAKTLRDCMDQDYAIYPDLWIIWYTPKSYPWAYEWGQTILLRIFLFSFFPSILFLVPQWTPACWLVSHVQSISVSWHKLLTIAYVLLWFHQIQTDSCASLFRVFAASASSTQHHISNELIFSLSFWWTVFVCAPHRKIENTRVCVGTSLIFVLME